MDPSPPHFISESLVFALSLCSVFFLGFLGNLRTQMTTGDQSAFEIKGNAVYLIIAVAMLVVSEVTSLILFWTTILSKYYATLEFFGIFSAVLGPFSLMLVMGDSDKHDQVYWLLFFFILGIIVAYINCGDEVYESTLNKRSLISVLTHLGLLLVPAMLLLVVFVPITLDWMVYPLVYTSTGMQAISFLIVYFQFMLLPMTIENEQNFHGIQEDKNTCNLNPQQDKKISKDLETNKILMLE